MRPIPLSNSDRAAWVSDEDYDAVCGRRWRFKKSKTGWYVACSVREGKRVRTLRLHREIARRMVGEALTPEWDIHHENGDTLMNTRGNLTAIEHREHSGVSAYVRDHGYGPA